MTFNEDARIDTSKVQRRRGGRSVAIGGGTLLGVVVLALASQLFGVDLSALSGLIPGGTSSVYEQGMAFDACETGADANENDECRMAGAADSLDVFWADQFSTGYRPPSVILYQGTTSSSCGQASAAIGPFYCPADESIYLDTAFFAELRETFGATGGPLAQMYVLAHEWGHHISHLTGQLDQVGQGSGADSDSVRLELQADCFAGAWVRAASSTTSSSGVAFLKPVSAEEMADALDAAAAIGDDAIQELTGHAVSPDSFTHGSSAQRQQWFQTGYQSGAAACDTFSVPAGSL